MCMCECVAKYNLFNLYDVTPMYVFRAAICVLFPGKSHLSFSQFLSVAYSSSCRLRLRGLSPVYFGLSVVVISLMAIHVDETLLV